MSYCTTPPPQPPPDSPPALVAVERVADMRVGQFYLWGLRDCSEVAWELAKAAGYKGARFTTYAANGISRKVLPSDWLEFGFRPSLAHMVAYIRPLNITIEAPHTGALIRWWRGKPPGFIWKAIPGIARLVPLKPLPVKFTSPVRFTAPVSFSAPVRAVASRIGTLPKAAAPIVIGRLTSLKRT